MEQVYQNYEVLQAAKVIDGLCLVQAKHLIGVAIRHHGDGGKSGQKTRREKLAFPTPSRMKSHERAYFCNADRVLALYNKRHGGTQQRVTNPVKKWFEKEAHCAGWEEILFLADTQASRSAGCMLRAPARGEVSDVTSH